MADEEQPIGPEAIARAQALAAEMAEIEQIQGNITSEAEKKLFIDQQTLIATREELQNIAEAKVIGDKIIAAKREEIKLIKAKGEKASEAEKASLKALDEQIALIEKRQGYSDEYVTSIREAADALEETLTKTDALEGATKRVLEATLGVGDAWKQSASGAFLNKVKTDGFASALKSVGKSMGEVLTMENLAGSIMTAVIQQTMKAVLAMDNARGEVAKALGSGAKYDGLIDDVYTGNLELGVSSGDAAKAIVGLSENMAGFGTMSAEAKLEATNFTAVMGEIGLDAATAGKFLTNTTKVMGMTTSESTKLGAELGGLANHLGVSIGSITSDFNSVMGDLAVYGAQAPKVFKKLAGAAATLGVSVDSLVGSMKDLDTVSGAAAAAGKMNAALGGQFMDTNELLNASLEERVVLIKKGLDASGKDFASMSRAEKQMVAQASGMKDVGELAKYMNADMGDLTKSMEDAGNATSSMEDMENKAEKAQTAQEKLTQALESLAIAIGPITDAFRFFVDIIAAVTQTTLGKYLMIVGAALYFVGGPLAKVVSGVKAFATSVVSGAQSIWGFLKGIYLKIAAHFKSAAASATDAAATKVQTEATEELSDAQEEQANSSENAGSMGKGFVNFLKELGKHGKAAIPVLLALGATAMMIGVAILIAAYGVAELVRSFAGFSAGEILAISVALAVFGATMVGIMSILVGLVTSGALPVSVAALYAFGIVMIMLGAATYIVAQAFVVFVGAFITLLPHLPMFGLFAVTLMLLAAAGMLMLPAGIMTMAGLIMMAVGIVALGLALKVVSSSDLRSLGMMMTGLGQVAQYAGAGMGDSVSNVKDLMDTLDDMSDEISSSIWLFSALGDAFTDISDGAIGALFAGMAIDSIGKALSAIPAGAQTAFVNVLSAIENLTDAAVERIASLSEAIMMLSLSLWMLPTTKMFQLTMVVERIESATATMKGADSQVATELVEAATAYSEIEFETRFFGLAGLTDPFTEMLKAASGIGSGGSGSGAGGQRSGFHKKEEATVVVLEVDGKELGRTVEKYLSKSNPIKLA